MLDHGVNHLAIIMDGNGRWATEQGKDRNYGHQAGSETLRKIAIRAGELGVKELTLYAFSTENWKRSEKEINGLLTLVGKFFDKYIEELVERNVVINFIGDLSRFPKRTQKTLDKTLALTKENDGLILNIAMNYGARQEIVSGIQQYTDDVLKNKRKNDLSVDEFSDYLMLNQEIDLLIRTSGELRLSNFLLWQISYSELYFTDVYWPDFDEVELEKALLEFKNRNRTFGG